ncbi:MAG: 3-oxoadipate enol-lactonase [Paracoccaceae bacterium]
MPLVWLDDIRLNAVIQGPADGLALVLIHALGLDLTIWDDLVARLPRGLRILRFDLRGHGASDTPAAPYAMGQMVRDAERLIDHFGLSEAVVLGLSIGGLVAQGLAVKRLDLVRGLILSNTAARIGIESQWQIRIAAVREGGMEAIADATLDRWFGRRWRDRTDAAAWRARLLAARPDGWCGAAAAIAGTDFYTTTATLRLPLLALAGDRDGSTPPDLVRETAELIPGADFRLIRGAGHLPFVEQPEAFAQAVSGFLTRIGHV